MAVLGTSATLAPLKGHRLPEDASIISAELPTSGASAPLKGHLVKAAADWCPVETSIIDTVLYGEMTSTM